MFSLQYKTRGRSSPSGKPRVFFCCHPDDFSYLDEAASDILQSQDCAVWYAANPAAPRDADYLTQLRHMQLLVIPITTRFLREPNDALNIDFHIARESGIPILPFMQEVGVETEFNARCGELQFLSKYDRSPGALPYKQKLEQFLASVLIGNALANRIRNSFSAYLFLSYRKKDRIHAQELMRLIHRDDSLRDVAIWYDEFLTPGENFNVSIHEALYRSDLFVLAVTPNLICETNYVMTTEYPMAIGIGKIVIPVELVPTDRTELSAKYPGISPCIDAHDGIALSQALSAHLPVKAGHTDPEHDYLIGLAYRSGIDVEVDHDRALILIRSSAEAGFSQATHTLADMYRKGIGVKKSVNSAVIWQKKLIQQLELEYRRIPDRKNLLSFVEAKFQCGEDLEAMSSHRDAETQYTDAMQLLINGVKSGIITQSDPKALTMLHRGCSYLGSICRSNGWIKQSTKFFGEALVYCEKLIQVSPGIESNRFLLKNYQNLIGCASASDQWEKAEEYTKKATLIASENVKIDPSWDSRMDMGLMVLNQSAIRERRGELEYARLLCTQACTIFSNLDQETEHFSIRFRRTLACSSLGQIYTRQRKYQDALVHLEKALELAKDLYRKVQNFTTVTTLADCYRFLGNCQAAVGSAEDAMKSYHSAVSLLRETAEKSQTEHASKALLLTYIEITNLCLQQKNYSEAEKCIQAWISMAQKRYEQTKNPDYQQYLELAAKKQAAIHRITGDPSQIEADIEQALYQAVAQYNQNKTRDHLYRVFCACVDAAAFYGKQGKRSKEKHYYGQAVELGQMLLKSERATSFCRSLFNCCKRLGELYLSENRPDQALRYWNICVQSEQIVCDQFRQAKSEVFYTDSLRRLANAYLLMARIPSSERNRFRDKAIELYEQIRLRAPANTKDKELLDRLKQGFYE